MTKETEKADREIEDAWRRAIREELEGLHRAYKELKRAVEHLIESIRGFMD